MSSRPIPGPFRPGEAAADLLRPATADSPAGPDPAGGTGHPAVDAAIQAIANAIHLSPADQVAQYEAAHRTLQEALVTIDQA